LQGKLHDSLETSSVASNQGKPPRAVCPRQRRLPWKTIIYTAHASLILISIGADYLARQQTDPNEGPLLGIKAVTLLGFVATWPFVAMLALAQVRRRAGAYLVAAAYACLSGAFVLFVAVCLLGVVCA
jgi:hypothetical protein